MAYRVNGTIRIDNSGNFNAGILTAVDANVTGVATATEFDGKVSSKAITEQTEGSESDVTGADEVLIYDQTTGDLLRVTVDEFVAGSGIGTLVTDFGNLNVTGLATFTDVVEMNLLDSFSFGDVALDIAQSVDVGGRLDLSGLNGRLGLATVNNGSPQDIRYVGVDSSLQSGGFGASDEVLPTEKAVKEYVDGNVSSLPNALYAQFDGTGAVGAITANKVSGFSSISKTATGRYSLTFTNTQIDSNYLVLITCGTATSLDGFIISQSTTVLQIGTSTNNNGAVNGSIITVLVYPV